MTTQETKGYKFEKVATLSLREGDTIKFADQYEGTTIARVKRMRRASTDKIAIEIDALWSTKGDNWYVKWTKEEQEKYGSCVIYKRRFSGKGQAFGFMLKGTAK